MILKHKNKMKIKCKITWKMIMKAEMIFMKILINRIYNN